MNPDVQTEQARQQDAATSVETTTAATQAACIAAAAIEQARVATAAVVEATCLAETASLVPSPTNPRKSFPASGIAELADSIRRMGVMTHLLVRPHPTQEGKCEIVAGERRWRAATLAGLAFVPVVKRDLTDSEVLDLQVIENLQREDLHPMEEAESYEKLLRDGGKGYTIEQVAARIGKERDAGYVRRMHKLLDLGAKARRAFRDGKIELGVALLLSRVPAGEQQDDALDRALGKNRYSSDGDARMSVAEVRRMVQSDFMLALDRAPFSIKDDKLVPRAGSCVACPKRTGNSPDLFAEVKDKGTCTDRACFGAKRTAHFVKMREEAAAKGQRVIEGDEARALYKHYSYEPQGYYVLDARAYGLNTVEMTGDKTVRQLLGARVKDVEVVLIQANTNEGNALQACAKRAEVERVLAEMGVIRAKNSAAGQAEADHKERQRQAERERKNEVEARMRALRALRGSGAMGLADRRTMALVMWRGLDNLAKGVLAKEYGWALGYGEKDPVPAASQAMDEAALTDWIRDMTLVGEARLPMWSAEKGCPNLDRMTQAAGVSLDAIRAQIVAEREAKRGGKKKAAGKGKAVAGEPVAASPQAQTQEAQAGGQGAAQMGEKQGETTPQAQAVERETTEAAAAPPVEIGAAYAAQGPDAEADTEVVAEDEGFTADPEADDA